MSQSIQIRPAGTEDLDTIVRFSIAMAMETESLSLDPATVTAGTRHALADEQKGAYFIAEVDGQVAGQLMITHEWSDWRNGDIWWIQSVYVDLPFRARGVFSAMYSHIEQLARQKRAAGLRLYVESENERAKKAYRRLGMTMTHYEVMEQMF